MGTLAAWSAMRPRSNSGSSVPFVLGSSKKRRANSAKRGDVTVGELKTFGNASRKKAGHVVNVRTRILFLDPPVADPPLEPRALAPEPEHEL